MSGRDIRFRGLLLYYAVIYLATVLKLLYRRRYKRERKYKKSKPSETLKLFECV